MQQQGLKILTTILKEVLLWAKGYQVVLYFGEGNGTPLQCSCLENPRDGGAWWAAVYGVAQSRTRLKRLSSSSSSVIFTETTSMKGRINQCNNLDCFKKLAHSHLTPWQPSSWSIPSRKHLVMFIKQLSGCRMTFRSLKMNQPPVRIMEVVHSRNTTHFLLSYCFIACEIYGIKYHDSMES